MTDEEDEFIEEIDHHVPKCGEIMQMLQNLRLFRFNEKLKFCANFGISETTYNSVFASNSKISLKSQQLAKSVCCFADLTSKTS